MLDEQEASYFYPLHTCQTDSEIHSDPNSVCCYVMILIAGVVYLYRKQWTLPLECSCEVVLHFIILISKHLSFKDLEK